MKIEEKTIKTIVLERFDEEEAREFVKHIYYGQTSKFWDAIAKEMHRLSNFEGE